MAKKGSAIPKVSSHAETDYEFGRRENENIDRAAWRGEHAMKTQPLGVIHTAEVAEHIPSMASPTLKLP